MATETQRAAPEGPFDASREIPAWASEHFGLITTSKLDALGVTAKRRRTMRHEGWLLPTPHRGVHRVGHDAFVPGQREALALAASGRRAMLSGWSAGGWLELVEPPRGPVRVLVPGGHAGRVPGVIRSSTAIAPDDVVVRRGLRCTGVMRTLLDLPGHAPRTVVRAALVEALRRGHDVEPLHERVAGRRGARLLREELELLFPALARTLSELEVRFLRLLRLHAIALPEVNVAQGSDLLDCRWPGTRLVVELDGRRWHQAHFERDRARDRRRLREGLVPLRFTWADVTTHERETVADVAALLRPR